MVILPWLRAIVFAAASLLALVVVGLCAHLEYLIAGYQDVYTSFAAFALAVGGLTVMSLPLLLIVGRVRRGAFTSMIISEIIWMFVLWVLWIGTAGDTVAGRSYYFPDGCIYFDYTLANQICYEITTVEAAAFVIFFFVFMYCGTILLFAIIQAIRGKPVWTISIAEASEGSATPGNAAVVAMAQPGPAGPYPPQVIYGQNAAPQPYNPYPAQPPYNNHMPTYVGPGNAPPGQAPFGGYAADASPNMATYSAYSLNNVPHSPQSGVAPTIYSGYPPSPSSNAPLPPHPVNIHTSHLSHSHPPSPSGNAPHFPPQSNYISYASGDQSQNQNQSQNQSQGQFTPRSGHQELRSQYGTTQAISV